MLEFDVFRAWDDNPALQGRVVYPTFGKVLDKELMEFNFVAPIDPKEPAAIPEGYVLGCFCTSIKDL